MIQQKEWRVGWCGDGEEGQGSEDGFPHIDIPDLLLFSSGGDEFGNQRNEKRKGQETLYKDTIIQSPLHEVAQRHLLPRPTFSIEIVPL